MDVKIKSIEDENLALQRRLESLNMLEKKMKKKKKPKIKIMSHKQVVPTNNDNFNVQSKIDYELIEKRRKQKDIEYKKKKVAIEMQNCTFKPSFNKKSKQFVDNTNYVPIHKRKLLEPKPEPVKIDKELEEFEEIQRELQKKPKPKVDINEFYKRQEDWDKMKTNKNNQKRLNQALQDYNVTKGPRVNKKKNKELVKNNQDFLKRVNNNMEKSQREREKLEKRYNNNSFQPKINRNIQVESKVVKKFIKGEESNSEDEEEYYEEEEYDDDEGDYY